MFNELYSLPPLLDDDVEFLPLVSIEKELKEDTDGYEEVMPVLPLRSSVLFPGVIMPITVSREQSVKAVKEAYQTSKFLGVVAQKDPEIDEPNGEHIYFVGTIARIIKLLKMPEGGITVILQGRDRFVIQSVLTHEPYINALIQVMEEKPLIPEGGDGKEFEALVDSMKDIAARIIQLSPDIPNEANSFLQNVDSPEALIHFISSNLSIDVSKKQMLLETKDMREQGELVLGYLHTEMQMRELKTKIQSRVLTDIDKQQRDYFLHQQLKVIQEELGTAEDGGGVDDIRELKERAAQKKWGKAVQKTFNKELKKLQRMNPMMPDYGMLFNYLEWLLDLPWNEYSKDNFDLKRAQKVLDKDHYGLAKIKDRIIEHLAVLKLKKDMKSPILCFVGPPGVGKTSLGKSIAKALKREYVRMSLGGLKDESEIRGHRRTYLGAMPGRIIQLLKKAQTANPVFILDEIDKVGSDFRGDPSSALLEVLDPEQNTAFYDNYIEAEFDLSNIMFVATANSVVDIQPALRDRMEIIYLSGYSTEEKMEIAKRHLIPKQRKEHGLTGKQVRITQKAVETTIEEYTRESGVRNLERKVAALMRFIAKSIALEEEHKPTINPEAVRKILGISHYDKEVYQDEQPAGVSVGLAWTQTGGDILFIETLMSKGKGKLTLTGNLGDVMKESAANALTYIKANADTLGVDTELFEKTDFHVHVPEGAIPKDGPSAGIAMLSALTSSLTGKKVRPYTAMTGEITLRGKVLPVGGIKEKVLAAKRAGLKDVLLCYLNEKDVEEINADFIKGVSFHYVKNMQEVLDFALVN